MRPLEIFAAVVFAAFLGGAPLHATIDRRPELRSRPLAWTEFDGSFLVDTSSRAEMLNFYWTVLARPYPPVQWSGSAGTANAGATSERWRIREYAQLNAYRTLNYSPPMTEDSAKLSLVQEGALILALNPQKPVTHTIDPTWNGYTAAGATALATSLIGGASEYPMMGTVDGFINDPGASNAALVGHRTTLLRDGNISGAVGAAFCAPLNSHFAVWSSSRTLRANPLAHFIAFPAPGFMPLALYRSAFNPTKFRWSFVPSTDERDFDSLRNASVSAKVNGIPTPIQNLVRNFNPHPLTWEFDPADFDFRTATDGTAVEIMVTNVIIAGKAYEYRYTVTLFDENAIRTVGFNPGSALKNISTRGRIGTGNDVLIAGFTVGGTLPVRVALRTQGPGLARYGVTDTATTLTLRLYDSGGGKLGDNIAWKEHQDWRLMQSLAVSPTDDREPAMVATLWPGSYTAVVSNEEGTGTGIVEVFNIDNRSPSRLLNLSTRGFVGHDDQALIAGIVIHEQPRTIVIRTQGPGLARFGVANAVSDTRLTLVAAADGQPIAENDDWRADSLNQRLLTDLAAFAPSDTHEAALVRTLPPGAYTALVTAKGDPGTGIVEVFELSDP